MIEQATEFFFPGRWKEFDAKFPKETRHKFLLWASLAAFAIASFQAFTDVNHRLWEAQEKLASRPVQTASGARMVFSRVEPEALPEQVEINGTKQNLYTFKVWFQNSGPLAAQSLSLKATPILTVASLSKEEEEKYMNSTISLPSPVYSNEVQPGDKVFYYPSGGYLGKAWEQFSQEKQYFYLFAALTYRDEVLTSPTPISTEVCIFFPKGDMSAWHYCGSGHNKVSRPR